MARSFLGTHYNPNIQGQYRGDKKYQTTYSNKYFNQPPYPQRNSGDVYKVLGQTKISKYAIFTKRQLLRFCHLIKMSSPVSQGLSPFMHLSHKLLYTVWM